MNEIKEIQIVPIKPIDGLVGFASCVFGDSIYLGNIAIHTRPNGGFRLVFPAKKISNQLLFYHNPISKGVAEMLEKVIGNKYQEVINKSEEIEGNYGTRKEF